MIWSALVFLMDVTIAQRAENPCGFDAARMGPDSRQARQLYRLSWLRPVPDLCIFRA